MEFLVNSYFLETITFDGFAGYEYGSKSSVLEQYLQMLAIPLLGFTYLQCRGADAWASVTSDEDKSRQRAATQISLAHHGQISLAIPTQIPVCVTEEIRILHHAEEWFLDLQQDHNNGIRSGLFVLARRRNMRMAMLLSPPRVGGPLYPPQSRSVLSLATCGLAWDTNRDQSWVTQRENQSCTRRKRIFSFNRLLCFLRASCDWKLIWNKLRQHRLYGGALKVASVANKTHPGTVSSFALLPTTPHTRKFTLLCWSYILCEVSCWFLLLRVSN